MKQYKNRKGFTLVEFLIVATMVGVLSQMMFFTKIEASNSAKVNNIISNLKNLKVAALAHYAQSMDLYNPELDPELPNRITNHLSKYLNANSEVPNYYIAVEDAHSQPSWWICYNNVTDNIREKLIDKTKSAGLKVVNIPAESTVIALQIR